MSANAAETKKDRTRTVTIIINAEPFEVEAKKLSFEEILDLAYDGNPPTGPNVEITVKYRRGPAQNREGTLIAGETVKIKKGMVFVVRATDKS